MSDGVTIPTNIGESTAPSVVPLHEDGASWSKVESIPDLTPFDAEPILLRPLYNGKIRASRLWKRDQERGRPSPAKVGGWTALMILSVIGVSAAVDHSFFRSSSKVEVSLPDDMLLFLTRSPNVKDGMESMPYLRDYPSLALTATIILTLPVVYGILLCMAELHKSLGENGCIRLKRTAAGDVDSAARKQLIEDIDKLNGRLRFCGWLARFALPLIICFVAFVNLRQQGELYSFLGIKGLYDAWWAKFPHPAGVFWILFGSLGMYLVWVEAYVGVAYVRFLRNSDIRLGVNRHDPDRFYGWSKPRQAILYLQAGFFLSAISTFAMSFIFPSATGQSFAAFLSFVFIGVIIYVYGSAIVNFRQQVKSDRKDQIGGVLGVLEAEKENPDPLARQVATLVAYHRLQAIHKIPPMPIRKSSAIAGPVVAALIGLAGQVLKYLS